MSGEDEPRRLHPATLPISILDRLPQILFGFAIPVYFVGGARLALIVTIIGGLGWCGWRYIEWRRFTYSVRDGQLVIESGVLGRNRRTIPFNRIQDVSLERKLLARLFGVAAVRIETGSAGQDEGRLDFITAEEAGELRDAIRRYRAGEAVGEGTASAEESGQGTPLFAMDPGRLLLFGLFGFSLVFLAVIGGVWQYVGAWGPERYLENGFERALESGKPGQPPIDLTDTMADVAAPLAAQSLAMLALLIVLAGVLAGVARTFARDFGFRLTRTESGLRRERGLFTRTDVVVPLRRVQAAIVSTGIVRRALGWYGLELQSLASDGGRGGHHAVAPFARPAELAPILAEIGLPPPSEPSAFHRCAPASVARRSLLLMLPALPLAIAGAVTAFMPALWAAVAVAALAPVAALLAYRAHGWRIEGDLLFVRCGIWRPGVTIIRTEKLQSATVMRGPLQRALGTVTLALGTAGAPRTSPLRIVDLDEPAARALMDGWLAPPAQSFSTAAS